VDEARSGRGWRRWNVASCRDDGITFEPIETDSSDHFWAIVPSGNGAFLSGENGSVLWFHEAGDATWNGRPDRFANDGDLTPREDARPMTTTMTTTASPIRRRPWSPPRKLLGDDEPEKKASQRWIREGLAFKKDLNAYVRRIYSVGYDRAGTRPTEPRTDMRRS